MDRLNDIFERQTNFQIALDKNLGRLLKDKAAFSEHDLQNLTKDTVLQLFSEIHEVLSEVKWKDTGAHFDTDRFKIKEEIIDVFHFVINLALIWGMDADELYKEFVKKNNKNYERFIK